MTNPLSRRRFLTISAAAATLPALAHAAAPVARWHGIALGAPASLQLSGLTRAQAEPVFAAVELELDRLEGIFSLYRPDSDLSRLNRDGELTAPAPEMLELLSLCTAVHASTGGAFDPTIQPLWTLFADHAGNPPADLLKATRAVTGWASVSVTPGRIALARPGMAMTLNGIAQGHVTDRIAALLRARGLTDVLVDMGEIAGSGNGPDGWSAGIAAPDGQVIRRTTLRDRALATSAPLGTRFGKDDRIGHILDPRRGAPDAVRPLVSVTAGRAALADALSTAFCLMSDSEIGSALKRHETARVEVTRPLETPA